MTLPCATAVILNSLARQSSLLPLEAARYRGIRALHLEGLDVRHHALLARLLAHGVRDGDLSGAAARGEDDGERRDGAGKSRKGQRLASHARCGCDFFYTRSRSELCGSMARRSALHLRRAACNCEHEAVTPAPTKKPGLFRARALVTFRSSSAPTSLTAARFSKSSVAWPACGLGYTARYPDDSEGVHPQL